MTDWRPTRALIGAAVLGILALGASLLAARPSGVVLAAPFLGYVALCRLRRPRDARTPEVTVVDGGVQADPRPAADGADVLATIGWPRQPGLRLVSPTATTTDTADRPVASTYASSRYGRQELGPLTWLLSDPLGGFRTADLVRGLEASVRPPAPANRDAGPLTAPIGTIGPHPSPRPGPGTTLADVRPHAAGDERRRINWRVTARTRALHTNTTERERDTAVLIVADTRFGLAAGRASLDATADALAALTQQYAAQGDRVEVTDPSGRLRPVPAGTGRRQALRVVEALSAMPRSTWARTRAHVRRPWPRVRPGSVVLVCSPLLDDEVLAGLGVLVARGCQCVVVDTLPDAAAGLDTALLEADQRRVVLRLRRALRQPIIDRLRAAGIPVVSWTGPATLVAVSRALAERPALRRRP